jgi:hypothetical protein
MNIDRLEEFRNNFFKKVEEDKIQKEQELKRKQKMCFHKYTIITPYTTEFSIVSCERCKHVKFVKN